MGQGQPEAQGPGLQEPCEREIGVLKIWYTGKPQNYPKLLFLMGKIMGMDWSWEHQGPFWELSV
jgi:hypothetical protein